MCQIQSKTRLVFHPNTRDSIFDFYYYYYYCFFYKNAARSDAWFAPTLAGVQWAQLSRLGILFMSLASNLFAVLFLTVHKPFIQCIVSESPLCTASKSTTSAGCNWTCKYLTCAVRCFELYTNRRPPYRLLVVFNRTRNWRQWRWNQQRINRVSIKLPFSSLCSQQACNCISNTSFSSGVLCKKGNVYRVI
jgi:hypothetical protein